MVKPTFIPPHSKRTSFEEAVEMMARVMDCLGFPLGDENFKDTPARFVKYLQEYHQPADLGHILKTGFQAPGHEYRGLVAQSNIPFRTICPHHLLPVVGRTSIGYIPEKRVVGLSKLARVVKAIGQQLPAMQEEITDTLANVLMGELEARGVIVVITAHHMCMEGRGVAVHNVPTTTSSVRGVFRDVPAARDEFFRVIRDQGI